MDAWSSRLFACAMIDRWIEHLANGHELRIPPLGRLFTVIFPREQRPNGIVPCRRRLRFRQTQKMYRLMIATLGEQMQRNGMDPDNWPFGEDVNLP